jgi:chromosome segregation ATPase
MEEDKTKVVDEKNTLQAKDDKVILQTKDDKATPDWLAPILSALGSMGGSYMLFIKPLQERLERLANQLTDLRAEAKELKQQNKETEKNIQELEKSIKQMQENKSHSNSDYISVKEPIGQGNYVKKRF